MPATGFDVLTLHRNYGPLILAQDGLLAAAPFFQIAADSPLQPSLLGNIKVDFQVEL